jgi:hypothetical protein
MFGRKHTSTYEQAAHILGLSVEKVQALVTSGDLQMASRGRIDDDSILLYSEEKALDEQFHLLALMRKIR